MNATEKWIPPQRRRVFLVRHGEVSYFDEAGRPFRPDLVPLNAEGRRQAECTARALAEVAWDRVITSGLRRTQETAEILLQGKTATVQCFDCLQEIRPGKLEEGHSPAQVQQAFLASFGDHLLPETTFLGGETFGSLLARVLPWWSQLLADPAWNQVLLVAHGGVNRAILGQILNTGLAAFGLLEQDPCCVNLIEVEPSGHCWLRLVNFTAYDPLKASLRLTTMEGLYMQFLGTGR
jgi:probable phosphoglycerate mutase